MTKKIIIMLVALSLLLTCALSLVACDNDVAGTVTHTVTVDGVKQTVTDGKKAVEPTQPTKDGYAFAGWVDDKGEAFDFDTAITADTTVVSAWNVAVSDAQSLMAELDKGTEVIVVDSSFDLVLDETLVLDYTVTIMGTSQDIVLSVSRSDNYTGHANDSISVLADNVVISNLSLDFDIADDKGTYYGITVGTGGNFNTEIDSFTLRDVTLSMSNSSLSGLYIGDGAITGTFTVDSCTFIGASIGVQSTDMSNVTIDITNNTFLAAEQGSLFNYFFVYAATQWDNDPVYTVDDVTVNFTDNTLSGKVVNSKDKWLGNGVENHLADEITVVSSGNTVTVTADELQAITTEVNADSTVYVLDGFTFVHDDNSYTVEDLLEV